MFLDLDQKRHLWDADQAAVETERRKYNISVYARFKPLGVGKSQESNGRRIVLPLSQRLALIKLNKGLGSNKEALGVLKASGGWFKERTWDEVEEEDPEASIDIRAEDQSELTSGIKMIDAARVVISDSTKGLREFQFDGVMKDDISQKQVFDITTRRLVCDVVNGVSATCLVYGQTGAGKSYSMFGPSDSSSPSLSGYHPTSL